MLQFKATILVPGLLVGLVVTLGSAVGQVQRASSEAGEPTPSAMAVKISTEFESGTVSVLNRDQLPKTEVKFSPQQRQFRRAGQKADKTPLNAKQVNKSVTRAVEYLKSKQNKDGTWSKVHYPGDATALCTLALLNSGEKPNAAYLRRALDNIQAIPREATYVVSLRIMALAAADPKGEKYIRDVEKDVQWLLDTQRKTGSSTGSWGYGHKGDSGDSSNTQFALLALHEATRMGVEIPKANWERAKLFWERVYRRQGGFGYFANGNKVYGSMTCAGISSWIIIHENLADTTLLANGEFANCCQKNAEMEKVETAFAWLAKNYSVKTNPRKAGGGGTALYYLYGLERAARLAGRRFIGANDWYRDGAKHLLKIQNPNNGNWITNGGHGESSPLVATSFGLLFLSKGKRPVAIGKFNHGVADWDLHPKGVHYLTRRLESEWKTKLNWQTVKAEDSTVDDLLEAPVLFMSGKDAIGLTDKQKETLKSYLENGGFLFAEACEGDSCGSAVAYDRAFRELMAEIFPDSQLERLEKAHPIWTARYPLPWNEERPLLGLQACCRTSVVYCPTNLSCYWNLDRPAIMEDSGTHKKLKKRIEYCSQMGVNVVAYATGRVDELKDKGETPTVADRKIELLNDRVLVFPKLRHGGGADDAPNAWRHILRALETTLGLDMKTEKKMISPTFEELADHPFIFVHGRTGFSFTDAQRKEIRDSLEHGGFIFADSICASEEFTKSFRSEMKRILEKPLRPIPPDHPIWNGKYGYKLERVKYQTKDAKSAGKFNLKSGPPQLEMGEYNGRMAVVFSPLDISCALENIHESQCNGYTHESAKLIGMNVVLYYLLNDE